MRVSVTDGLPSGDPGPGRVHDSSARSLVPLCASSHVAATGRSWRPSAAFLAQLIAIAQQAPQTRLRRRAEAGNTADLYGTATARARTQPAISRLV